MGEHNGEYIDHGFKPNLEKLIKDKSTLGDMAIRGINSIGRPAPTLNGRKAAYWMGSFTLREEAPVLAVSVHPSQDYVSTGHWYFGIAVQRDFDTSDDRDIYALEVAANRTLNHNDAIKMIIRMFPQKLYDQLPNS